MLLRTKANASNETGDPGDVARLHAAFDAAPLAMAIVGIDAAEPSAHGDVADADVRVHRWNDAFDRLASGLDDDARAALAPYALVAATLREGTPRRATVTLANAHPDEGAVDSPRLFDVAISPLFGDGHGPAPTSALVSVTPTTVALARAARLHERLRGMVGHDLRNPLSAVMTAASLLLRRGGLPPIHESAARRIESASLRMARMIGHMVELSRAALNEPTTAVRSAADLATIVRSAAREHGEKVDVVIEAAHLGEWDSDLLHDAVACIVRNAVEHARAETRPRIVLRAVDDDHVELLIDNDGAPIAEGHASRIVDPEALGDHGKRPGHLGLGLFVAARAIAAHGGTVAVTPRGTEGTRVRVVLPVHGRAAASATPQ